MPDYFDIVKSPMCWTMIDAKINKFEYWDFQAFRVRHLCIRFMACLRLHGHRTTLNLLLITPSCTIKRGLSSTKMPYVFKRNQGPFLTLSGSWSLSMVFPLILMVITALALMACHLLATWNLRPMYLNS